MKKLMLVVLILGSMFVDAQAKEPTIEETVAFIQKVIKSDEYSSDYYYGTTIDHKPLFDFDNTGCKIKIIQFQSRQGKKHNGSRRRVYIDLSKHKAEIKRYENDYVAIIFNDRQGIATIRSILEQRDYSKTNEYELLFPENDITRSSNNEISFNIHGVYKEKMNKALQHLSNKCYEKYGVKNDDPF